MNHKRELLSIVIGILRNTKNEVLLGKRMKGKNLKGYWEFPGGKIELNETPEEALFREFQEELGIEIVIGPIFYENLKKINKINNITFISLTNTNQNLPNEIIAFGINFESQLEAITQYLIKKKIEKTILLLPESEFGLQIEPIIQNHKFKFYKTYHYNTTPEKITAEIEKITNYKQRKINLNARVKILEKSDLEKDKRELEKLKEQYTLGKVDFTSVVIADFGERLKSVLTSFTFTDVTSRDVKFFTLNQWFNESFFGEQSFQELIFPSINQANCKLLDNSEIF